MCGILGIVRNQGSPVGLTEGEIVRMRDTMVRRGPDGAGLWREPSRGHVALAHRRLAVVDLHETGAQPMQTAVDPSLGVPRFTIVYNGELYNDAELREQLCARGVTFRGSCDTETVLRAFEVFGLEAIPMLRGMFALGVYDAKMRVMTLARDALGVKPLYYWAGGGELVFASDPRAILAHPRVSASPNWRMLSAYLTTIRTTLAGETLFEGVRTLSPGHVMLVDCDGPAGEVPHAEVRRWWRPPSEEAESGHAWSADVRASMEESLALHLRSDVPTCALLSGGLDSAITATLARDHLPELRTYCAGDGASADDPATDLSHAREVARTIGSRHREALLDQRLFSETWAWMVGENGLPLSTPNETAIYAVARALREDGCVVTISGEGADELFAGYEPPLDAAMAMVGAGGASGTGEGAGIFELNACAWTPLDFKPGVLDQEVWHLLERDRWLLESYEREFRACIEDAGGYGLGAHQRFYRRINLTGLLRRLDTSTMLASVEGRTPFADARVAELAERIPMSARFSGVSEGGGGLATAVRSKLVLREAFADRISPGVLVRPKASFPLPFQQWIEPDVSVLRESSFARSVFQDQAIETVASNPTGLWNLAWPMMNIARWGDAMGW